MRCNGFDEASDGVHKGGKQCLTGNSIIIFLGVWGVGVISNYKSFFRPFGARSKDYLQSKG